MAGSIILTGANGSLGLNAAERLLQKHSQYNVVLTVRNAAETDPNTQNLRNIIAKYPDAKVTIHQLDHATLADVHNFATKVSTAISAGEYPHISSIICNAAYWNLVADAEITTDSYDKTLQVSHIAHAALVLRLIGDFTNHGRIVLLSSIGHYHKPNAMTSLLPEIPDDMDQLNRPAADDDKKGRGFQRYASSKLVTTTWMYSLNNYLQQNPNFKNITAVAINPGGLGDSRVFTTNTPLSVQLTQRFILKPFMPVINRLADPTFRSPAAAGVDVAELAVGAVCPGERGYFTLLDRDESDPMTMDKGIQQRVREKTLEWARITRDNTALSEAFESAWHEVGG